jgi:hypothetical protein
MGWRLLVCVALAGGCSRANPLYVGDDLSVTDDLAVDEAPDLAVPDLAEQRDLAGSDLARTDLADLSAPAAPDLSGVDLAGADLAAPMCADDNFGKSCNVATPVGSLHIGGTQPFTGVLPSSGEENWFQVSFPDANKLGYHPRASITSADGDILFDVYQGSCALTALGCGEGGSALGMTTWEVFGANCDSDGGCTPAVGSSGQILIRVFRASATPTCHAYTLTLSD